MLDEFAVRYEVGPLGFTVRAPVMHGFRNADDDWRVRSGSGIAGRGGTWMLVRVNSGHALSSPVSTRDGLRRALREFFAGPVPDPIHPERYYAAMHHTRFESGHYVWKLKKHRHADHDRHGEYDECRRCGYRGQISRAPAYGGFLQQAGDLIVCWNGRECSLRLRRQKRKSA